MEANSEDDSSNDEQFDYEEIEKRDYEKEKREIMADMLPKKSQELYELVYKHFMNWLDNEKDGNINEAKLVVYFKEITLKYKPSSAWSRWSMLRTTLSLRHGINLNNYEDLKIVLKNFSRGYKAKKSSVLTWDEVQKFLETSDENIYLGMQVILLFGIFGALRCAEYSQITTNDIIDTGSLLIISVRDTKNNYPREFIIGNEYYNTIKKYSALRPADTPTNRFFIQFKKGSCTKQVIGRHTIAATANAKANYLNLPNPKSYTGHCFRRSSATILSNTGANLVTLKMHAGWRSDEVAQGYLEHSLANKQAIFDSIASTKKMFHQAEIFQKKSVQSNSKGILDSAPSTSYQNIDVSVRSESNIGEDTSNLNLRNSSFNELQIDINNRSNEPVQQKTDAFLNRSLKDKTNITNNEPSFKRKKLNFDVSSNDKFKKANMGAEFNACSINQVTVHNYYNSNGNIENKNNQENNNSI